MPSSWKKPVFILVGLLALAFVVYEVSGLLQLASFSGPKLVHAIREANPYYLILSLVAIYACYAIRSLRWQVFQRNLGNADFWKIYKLTLAGFAAIFLMGRAGEPARPLLLAKKQDLPLADTVGIYVLERIFDMACVAVIAAAALVLFSSRAHSGETTMKLETAARTSGTIMFVGVAAAAAVLVYLRLHGTAMLEQRLQVPIWKRGWRKTVSGMVLGFARGVQTMRSFDDLILSIFYSAAHWALVAMVYYWIIHSFSGTLHELGLRDALVVLAFTLIGSSLQLPGVGGGSQAGSIIAFTAIYGVEREPAVAAAMVLWLITFAACSIAGVPLLIHEGLSLGELRRMADEEKKQLATP